MLLEIICVLFQPPEQTFVLDPLDGDCICDPCGSGRVRKEKEQNKEQCFRVEANENKRAGFK